MLSSVCGLERAADETLWVRLRDTGGQERWRVIDVGTLSPTQEFTAPLGVEISAFSDDLAYGIRTDDSGAPHVLVYRIE